MPSGSVEDYLKQVYQLHRQSERVSTSALAERLSISPAAVSDMVKKLAGQGLLSHTPYRGVELTADGLAEALCIIRRHRLWEQFLVEKLRFRWDEVHELAEQLEHVRSPELELRLAEFLGHPELDPHGDPIPSADGSLPMQPDLVPLSEWPLDQPGTVVRVADDPELLRYLAALGLRPGTSVRVTSREPFGGPLVVRADETDGITHYLGEAAARHVFVARPAAPSAD